MTSSFFFFFKQKTAYEIHGQLFVPRGRTAAGPALLFMHGGSRRQMMLGFHYMQYYHNAYAENQYLASRGFVVLSVNYRTGIMYGRAFREREKGGPRGAEEYQDIVAAAKYLQTLAIVDTKKRSEERRVGKECRSRRSTYQRKKRTTRRRAR